MSSLPFLGLSLLSFLVTFGIMFYLLPMILGAFFSVNVPILDPDWQATNNEMQNQLMWLIPLSMSLGLFIVVLKVLMAATSKGRD